MGRIKEIDKGLGQYPYYVEIWDGEKKLWKAEVRYYLSKQDVKDYPDNDKRRNFKYIGNDKAK